MPNKPLTKAQTYHKLASLPATNKKPAQANAPQFITAAPPSIVREGKTNKHHLEQMEVGMALDVPSKEYNNIKAWGKRHGAEFTSRGPKSVAQDKNQPPLAEGHLRIYRTK